MQMAGLGLVGVLIGFLQLPCVIPSSSHDPMKLNPDWFLTLPPISDIDGGEVERIGVF